MKKFLPWLIWAVPCIFYFYDVTLRVLPSTMANHLMAKFNFDPAQFGAFAAYYYYSYTPMQMPVGIILDHFSIRKSLITASFLCIGGLLLVHMVNNVHIASLGRFIMGFGCAFAYVAVLKVASIWLSDRHFGLAACIADSLGMLAGIFADLVVTKMNSILGYSNSMWMVALIGVLVALLIMFVLQDSPKTKALDKKATKEAKSFHHIFYELGLMVKNPQIWLIGLVGALAYLPSSALGDVWGIPYLAKVYHMTTQEAGRIMSVFFLGWMVIGPFMGQLSDFIRNRKLPFFYALVADAILLTVILCLPDIYHGHVPHFVLYIAFFFFGAIISVHPLVFALAKENYEKAVTGTAVALTNCLVMVGGIVFQPLTGRMIDLAHKHFSHIHHAILHQHLIHIAARYTEQDYTWGIAIIPVALAVAAILTLFIRDTGHLIE